MKDLGVFIDWNVVRYPFRSPKKYKATKQAFWCTKNLHGIVRNSGSLDYNELQNVLPKSLRAEYFAKAKEKCKRLSNLMDKEVENLDDHGCLKIQERLESDKQMWICSSYPF